MYVYIYIYISLVYLRRLLRGRPPRPLGPPGPQLKQPLTNLTYLKLP